MKQSQSMYIQAVLPSDLTRNGLIRYFKDLLVFFSQRPFYTTYVTQPSANDPCPTKILSSPKFCPFFKDVIGVIDGTHIHVAPPAHLRGPFQNHKARVSQNALFTCSFNMLFNYVLAG
jgi:hypothetical protein